MGHHIEAFVGKSDQITGLLAPIGYESQHRHTLPQGFELLLFDYDPLIELVCNYLERCGVTPSQNPADWMIQYAATCGAVTVGYIHTDYFGGVGSQYAMLIDAGRPGSFLFESEREMEQERAHGCIYPTALDQEPINTVLKQLGVRAEHGMDEFDSIRLGDFRHMPEF